MTGQDNHELQLLQEMVHLGEQALTAAQNGSNVELVLRFLNEREVLFQQVNNLAADGRTLSEEHKELLRLALGQNVALKEHVLRMVQTVTKNLNNVQRSLTFEEKYHPNLSTGSQGSSFDTRG